MKYPKKPKKTTKTPPNEAFFNNPLNQQIIRDALILNLISIADQIAINEHHLLRTKPDFNPLTNPLDQYRKLRLNQILDTNTF